MALAVDQIIVIFLHDAQDEVIDLLCKHVVLVSTGQVLQGLEVIRNLRVFSYCTEIF